MVARGGGRVSEGSSVHITYEGGSSGSGEDSYGSSSGSGEYGNEGGSSYYDVSTSIDLSSGFNRTILSLNIIVFLYALYYANKEKRIHPYWAILIASSCAFVHSVLEEIGIDGNVDAVGPLSVDALGFISVTFVWLTGFLILTDITQKRNVRNASYLGYFIVYVLVIASIIGAEFSSFVGSFVLFICVMICWALFLILAYGTYNVRKLIHRPRTFYFFGSLLTLNQIVATVGAVVPLDYITGVSITFVFCDLGVIFAMLTAIQFYGHWISPNRPLPSIHSKDEEATTTTATPPQDSNKELRQEPQVQSNGEKGAICMACGRSS